MFRYGRSQPAGGSDGCIHCHAHIRLGSRTDDAVAFRCTSHYQETNEVVPTIISPHDQAKLANVSCQGFAGPGLPDRLLSKHPSLSAGLGHPTRGSILAQLGSACCK
jgi:hypothetical protein